MAISCLLAYYSRVAAGVCLLTICVISHIMVIGGMKMEPFKIRAKFGSDISRVLYFFFAGRRVVLTNGFVKKTQKTPKAEIELAKQYRKDFLRQVAEDV